VKLLILVFDDFPTIRGSNVMGVGWGWGGERGRRELLT